MNGDAKDINSDSNGIASIAKSVTTLAKAVSELQKQMKEFDQRLNDQESAASLLIGDNTRKKKRDFLRAYKAVISVVKALKVMPEIQEYTEGTGHEGESDHSRQSQEHLGANASQLLRTIALKLSDMETVASYVTQDDDVSTVEASSLSRPTDFVKIEERNNIPHNVDVNHSTLQGEIDTFKQILSAKDEQMMKLLKETQLQTQLLHKKSSWWRLANLASTFVLLGGVYIGNKYDFHQNHVSVNNYAGDWDDDKPLVLNSTSVGSIESVPIISAATTNKENKEVDDSSVEDLLVEPPEILKTDAEADGFNIDFVLEGENMMDLENKGVPETGTSIQNATDFGKQSLDHGIDVPGEQGSHVQEPGKITRGWLEESLCDELGDMMKCEAKKSNTKTVSAQATDIFDRATMQRMMIRRQAITAIGVAVAMTLPKIAPHIFKINLAQILSLSFWKSIMEFVTVLIQ